MSGHRNYFTSKIYLSCPENRVFQETLQVWLCGSLIVSKCVRKTACLKKSGILLNGSLNIPLRGRGILSKSIDGTDQDSVIEIRY